MASTAWVRASQSKLGGVRRGIAEWALRLRLPGMRSRRGYCRPTNRESARGVGQQSQSVKGHAGIEDSLVSTRLTSSTVRYMRRCVFQGLPAAGRRRDPPRSSALPTSRTPAAAGQTVTGQSGAKVARCCWRLSPTCWPSTGCRPRSTPSGDRLTR
jgi:hypothetical protein